ncbi:unnamed protein product [Caenorhabditis angaria]|uniref:Uncharacterized protein n=1 Tax=Caenorhabditis angaria TaxID=860376 RepID=A0A9P1IUA8_9PELO|nr:unnamed protein product [Caenorhabditis angaria]
MLHQVVGVAASTSIFYIFYFKFSTFHSMINYQTMSTIRGFLIFYIPTLISLVSSILIVIRDTSDTHFDTYNYAPDIENGITIAFLKLNTLPNMLNLSCILITTIGIPIITIPMYKRVKNILKNHVSSKTLRETRCFLRGMTIQTIFPLICSFPSYGLYFYCLLTGADSEFQQYFQTPLTCLPTIIDPIITILCVVPYRKSLIPKSIRACLLHGCLIYMIIRKSPKSFKLMKFLLLQTSISQLFLACLISFIQNRIIASKLPVEVRSYGLCRYFNSHFCYFIYMLHQVVGVAAASSICFMFYYKFVTFKSALDHKKISILWRYIIFYIPTIASLILSIIIVVLDPLDGSTPQIDEDNGLTIAYLKMNTIPNFLNLCCIALTTFCTPIISLIMGSKIRKSIHFKSSKTMNQTAIFLKGLVIQAIFPLFCYVPMFSFYYYCLLTGSQYYFQEFFLTPIVCFPVIIDPIVTMYFIIPYRNFIKSKFKFGRSSSQAAIQNAMTINNISKVVVKNT